MNSLTNKISDIYLLGAGNIGKALLDIFKSINPNCIKIRKIATSKKLLVNNHYINPNTAIEKLSKSNEQFNLDRFLKVENKSSNNILVDCTASESIAKEYLKIINNGFSIVTANKIANTLNQEYYNQLRTQTQKSDLKFKYETNVGAGLPIISTIQRLINTGDEIISIKGVLSGTLSYLFSTLNKTIPFSEILKDAFKKGFTEPDPRFDLSGIDVARKILILAREAGSKIELDDINVAPLFSNNINKNISLDEFLIELKNTDNNYQHIYNTAQLEKKVLRYIATWNHDKAIVGLQAVSNESPFFYQKGRENFVVIRTKRYDECPIVIKGHGAGPEVTAAGVFHDITLCQ